MRAATGPVPSVELSRDLRTPSRDLILESVTGRLFCCSLHTRTKIPRSESATVYGLRIPSRGVIGRAAATGRFTGQSLANAFDQPSPETAQSGLSVRGPVHAR